MNIQRVISQFLRLKGIAVDSLSFRLHSVKPKR